MGLLAGPACQSAAAACPQAGRVTAFAPGRRPNPALMRLSPGVSGVAAVSRSAPQVNSNKDRGRRELSSEEREENGNGEEMSVVTKGLAPFHVASGATINRREKQMLPCAPRCTEHFPKSLAELGFESSPFSFCSYLVFNFAPCLPIKDEKGSLVATNFFRFHKQLFHPACGSAH